MVEPLLALGPTELVIANRSPDRAVNLASLFVDLGAVRGCGFEDVGDEPFDLVINATAAGLTGLRARTWTARVIASHTVCYDMSYSKSSTPFVSWSIEQGCARAHKGWGMLVEQAAESFTLWRGVRPDTEPVLAVLGTNDHDANISGTALPAFDRIAAADVEPTIRELLQRNRGEVATPRVAAASHVRQHRVAARAALAPPVAHLVAHQPPERRAQFRRAARQLQRLPAAAV